MKHKPFYILPFLFFSTGFSSAQEQPIKIEKDSVVLSTSEKHTALLENLDESFAEWPKSIDFESPSFRLRIGSFKTRLTAERNLIAVRKKYPAAVLLKPQLIKNN